MIRSEEQIRADLASLECRRRRLAAELEIVAPMVAEETEPDHADIGNIQASELTSKEYRGIVLARAIGIVERDTRLSIRQLGGRVGLNKTTFYRHRERWPISQFKFDAMMEKLADIRGEFGLRIATCR